MQIYQSGVDVSRYQGKIDWTRVARDGKQFAILRAVSSDAANAPYEDPYYRENARGAAAAGLRIGAYYYTYATTTAYADREIALMIQVLAGTKFQYPIFIDVEDNSLKSLGRTRITELVRYALEKLRAAGYYPGVYTYTDFALNFLDMAALRQYPLYLADYTSYINYEGPYDLWQYTDMGSVQGIEDRVDLDVSYTDFLPRIQALGLNNYSTAETPMPMVPLQGFTLVVYGTKNCQYFNTANVNDVAGTLAVGRYPAQSQSVGCYNGFSWAKITVNGKIYWTALLGDRCYLTR